MVSTFRLVVILARREQNVKMHLSISVLLVQGCPVPIFVNNSFEFFIGRLESATHPAVDCVDDALQVVAVSQACINEVVICPLAIQLLILGEIVPYAF